MAITKKRSRNSPSGWKYYAQVCVKGKRPGKLFDTLEEAARWHDRTEAMLRSGKTISQDAPDGDMPFQLAADRYLIEAAHRISAGQVENYRYAQRHLVRSFGEKSRLGDITRSDVVEHVHRRMHVDGVGPSVVRKELSLIRLVYERARMWGIEYPSPESDVQRPKQRHRSREEALSIVITGDEIRRLLLAATGVTGNLRDYLLILLYSGMRPSEAAGLFWERLPAAVERERIKKRLPVGYVDLCRCGLAMVGTKTEPRFVPLHPVARDILKRMRLSREAGKSMVFIGDKQVDNRRPSRCYRRPFETAMRRAGLREGINLRAIRHTFRSRLIPCGIPAEVAETIVGHANVLGRNNDVMQTYIHISDEDMVREIAKLSYPEIEQGTLSPLPRNQQSPSAE